MAAIPAETRIETANIVLRMLDSQGTRIERRAGGWWVCWRYQNEHMERRWQTRRGNDFYPVWHRLWAHGGTMTTALSQLVRWCAGRPVHPIGVWRHWCGEGVRLGRDNGPQIIEALTSGGYPQQVQCVLCGRTVTGSLDWWSLDGVSGPCCGWTTGCRQKPSN